MDLLQARGWVRFAPDPALASWAGAALAAARQAIARNDDDWRCGGTWFTGVDALQNDAQGSIGGQPLAGRALAALTEGFGAQTWHRAQISALRAGYPRVSDDESPAAFRFRQTRDAAHIDGLLPVGPDRRRMIREPHGFILGIALNTTAPGASPPVLWDQSHRIMSEAFRDALSSTPSALWAETDVTAAYEAARRRVFAECARLEMHLEPGEALLLHRHTLHGISPWTAPPNADPRLYAYFRPELAGGVAAWVTDP